MEFLSLSVVVHFCYVRAHLLNWMVYSAIEHFFSILIEHFFQYELNIFLQY